VNNVKKNNLTRGAFALLLLASTAVGADQQYPAADFQPEVLYQDSDYIAKNSSSASTAKSPVSAPKTASSAAASKEVDSKYPAASFEPEVLYHDPNYKPGVSLKTTVSKEKIGLNQAESQSEAPVSVKKEESTMTSYLIGLVVLALAGFYFFKNRSTATVQKKAPAAPPAKTSYALTTGVAKYLNKVSGTGVSRYVEKQVKSASASATTGVAKYMAKQQAASPKATAAKAATGVEKYMRDRG
jgi:hypothetical protein